jgi:hypothetical protein
LSLRKRIDTSSSFKPMSWLGQIRSHRRDETWSASLWQTFFSTCMGAQIPVIAENPLTTCGCRKFQLDPLGDHLNTCTSHSDAKKTHDWMVDQITDLFRTTHRVKTQQVIKSLDGIPGTRVTGHPCPGTLVPGHFFFGGSYFFWGKKWEKTVFSLCFSSLSLSISLFLCTHSLGSF